LKEQFFNIKPKPESGASRRTLVKLITRDTQQQWHIKTLNFIAVIILQKKKKI